MLLEHIEKEKLVFFILLHNSNLIKFNVCNKITIYILFKERGI